ncbi:MAG: ATP-binding protein, partial [Gammaproteobacteria bacterium]|nr:ATP-binding protein [Gammaproteobacteria bacterium]
VAGSGNVHINIDPGSSSVRIRDDGPGLSGPEARAALIPIANSQKHRGRDRGFRGIGRLSGLGFAKSVTFRTRAEAGAPVAQVAWNAESLKRWVSETGDINQAISTAVRLETVPARDEPDHFFEVEIEGVSRQVANRILNRHAVRRYLAQTCPVPLSESFPFAAAISDFLCNQTAPLTLKITINDDPAPVTRPHRDQVIFSDTRTMDYTELETISVPSMDSDKPTAIGWLAHSTSLGAIPRAAGVGGVRAREGNMQVGGHDVFAHLFAETRFNSWCVGELHILDARITPNNQRYYFELNPPLRNLENHLGASFHRITARCRKASANRNAERHLAAVIEECEDAYALAASGFLRSEDANQIIDDSLQRLTVARGRLPLINGYAGKSGNDLLATENKLKNFPDLQCPEPFRGMKKSRAATFQNIFRSLYRSSSSPSMALELIQAVMADSKRG